MSTVVLWILFAVLICHGWTLLEATLLSARLPLLRQQAVAGSRGAGQLLLIKRTRIDDAISVILVLNTCGGTIGAGFAGAPAADGQGEVDGAIDALADIVGRRGAGGHVPTSDAAVDSRRSWREDVDHGGEGPRNRLSG
jgi:hypothetical protein